MSLHVRLAQIAQLSGEFYALPEQIKHQEER